MNEHEKMSDHERTSGGIASAVTEGVKSDLHDHLVALPGSEGEWALWRWVGLRGAGFPASTMTKLSAPECVAAADALIEAERSAAQAEETPLEKVRGALDAMQSGGDEDTSVRRALLIKSLRALKKGKLPQTLGLVQADDASLDTLRESREQVERARAVFGESFQASVVHISQAIHEAASNERFREAVIWQNRQAFHTGIETIARKSPTDTVRSSRHRQHEELVANYLQRYCTKNETIGFFGPVGWARFVPGGEAVSARPGQDLLAERNVYFEGWCIDKLAKMISKDKSLQQWFAPRRMPTIYLEGTTLHSPPRTPSRISEREAVLLRVCDGEKTAKTIARELCERYPAFFPSEEHVLSLLENLRNRSLISWSLEFPIEIRPEETLRNYLTCISDERVREDVLVALDKLEEARGVIAEASGNAARLDRAMSDMEELFTRQTGIAATRSAGELYAGRTLVYEDCRRDLEVEFGSEILTALGPPLSLLLAGARWLSYEAAKIYRKAFGQIYAAQARKERSSIIDLANFWAQARTLFIEKTKPTDDLFPLFQRHWAKILAPQTGQRRLNYTSEELRPRVMAAFNAPAPGWWAARYHSPDVMIAAPGVESIKRGDYRLALGEMHVATNTLGASLFLAQHPSPQDFFTALERDMPEIHVVPMLTKYVGSEQTARVFLSLVSPRDYYLEVAPDANNVPSSQKLPIAELVMENRGGSLIIRTRDGRLQFDAIEFCGLSLSPLIIDFFKILSSAAHVPRVTIDRLVVNRESWSFAPRDLSFANLENEVERFLAARRWLRERDMPSRLFAKVPVEKKPFYIDFGSPVYVDIISKMVRRTIEKDDGAGVITLTEMLPDLDETWLPDAEGNRYTSELRLVAVDLARPPLQK